MDNLFTSFPLLNKLSEMEIGGTSTVRQNRLNNVPIMNKKTVSRGTSDTCFQKDITLVARRDNKGVNAASNVYAHRNENDPNKTVKRYSRIEKNQSLFQFFTFYINLINTWEAWICYRCDGG